MLESLCRRFPRLRPALAVHERVSAIGGGQLAASVALAGFLSLFPLLLVAISVVGFVSAGNVDFAPRLIDELGLEGEAASQVLTALDAAESSRRAASVIGFLGLAWAGLGVVGALEVALNAPWQVTGRGLTEKLFGAAWLAGAGLLFLATMALGPALAVLPGPAVVPTVALGAVLDGALFLWMFRTLTNVRVHWRVHLPGAVLGGIGLELLKLAGALYVPHAVASASALYGSLGIVFAILAWFALSARLVVYAATLNVVRYEDRHGTVTVDLEVPHVHGEVPLEATRGGAVAETAGDAAPQGNEAPDPQPDGGRPGEP